MVATTTQGMATQVVIVGGGLVGSALGLALARVGIASIICDRIPLNVARSPDFDGRAYAIALASRRMLDRLGLWDAIAPRAQAIDDILVSDGEIGERASPFFLHFDSREMTDGFGHMVEDHVLRDVILGAAIDSPLVTYLDSARVSSTELGEFGAVVHLSDGRSVTAPLAVACDGRNSATARLAGIDRVRWDYDQVGLVCAIRHEKPHHGVAHEYFLPSGPFAILPLTGGNRSALVWTERKALAETLAAVDDAVYLAEIRRRFGDFLGSLSLEGKRWTYPLSVSVARDFAKDRLALVGDAARGIHPIAGQGLNYGFRDIAALAEVLADAVAHGEDIGSKQTLERYATWRRPDSLAIAMATDGLNRLFSTRFAPVRLARRLGLSAFGKVGPLRRTAMSFAAGARNDLPTIMRA